jgi:hypothetical protein
MAIIDDNFIQGYRNQIKVLSKLSDSVQAAIKDATDKLAQLDKNRGKNIEDVFGRMPLKQNPGGPSKDHKVHK